MRWFSPTKKIWVAVQLCSPLCFASAAERIALESFARPPQAQSVSLSPSGKWFAAIANRGDDSVVVSHSVDGDEPPKALMTTDNREFRFAWVRWVSNDRLLIGVHFPERRIETDTVETRMVAVDRDGGRVLPLHQAQFGGFAAQIQDTVVDWLPEDGHHVLIQAAVDRTDTSPAVYKLNVDTARREPVHGRRFGVRRWVTDAQHRVRVGIRQQGTQVDVLVCDEKGENWRTAWSYEVFSQEAVTPLGFGADPNRLFVAADEKGHSAIFSVDLRDPALSRTLVLPNDGQDVAGPLIIDPRSGEAIGVRASRLGDSAFALWEPSAKALARSIDEALPGRVNELLQFTADGSRYLVYTSGNGIPGEFMVGDLRAKYMSVLTRQYPSLRGQTIATKQSFTLSARDGLNLGAYLTLPPGGQSKNLPTVVLPHGGPLSRDSRNAFDPLASFLADRGYAVLQVNFRGSTGYGSAFRNAGLQRWGLEMQDDLTDALQWLTQRGTADPKRVCIVGASYGGYAALMGGAKNPDLYRCVVSLAGVSDLLALADFDAKFVNGRDLFERMVGSTWDDKQRLKDTSPARLASQFKAPVLLLHGTLDWRVPYAQSQAMHKALLDAEKPARLITFTDGDHNLGIAAHSVQFYRELEAFLAEHLAPRQ
jgi:dipeptidyl aminopeptidase/acylaminoacyl peptidase